MAPRPMDDIGICLLSDEGVVLHRDEAFVRALGMDVPRGSSLSDLLPWAVGAPADARLLAPTGDLELVFSSTSLPSVGAVVRAHRTVDEVSLLRDLQIARGMLASLLDASPVTILALDMQKNVTMWNAAAERMFGWTADEIIGRPYPLIPEGGWSGFEELFDRVVGGEGFTDVEARRRRKDGSPIELRIHTAPMCDPDGRVTGAMAILEDLTERLHLEEQIRHNHKMEALGRLAGGIAHDFNNLLTVILGTSEVLANDPTINASTSTGIGHIRECGEQARELTAQLLAFSRRQMLRPEVVDMGERVRSTVGMLSRLIGEQIETKIDLTDERLPICVDPIQFDQMLMNLVVNARDALEGGGELCIRTIVADGGDSARLEVSDTGTGIRPEQLSRIFDPFFTTKASGQGTGLGLATVHGIVEQSGGTVRVGSRVGEGTTFSVTLPLSDARPRPAPARPRVELPRGDETLLLVEDERQVRAVAEQMLSSLGYEVRCAGDGAEAIELLERGLEVSLVVTDLTMPKLGGMGLAARIRADSPRMPIVFISANLDDEQTRQEVDAGRSAFLQKPFTLAGLSRCVRACIDGAAT